MSTANPGAGGQTAIVWTEAQQSEEFSQLRRRFRGFVFPMTIAFLIWYEVYVVLSGFAPGFMGTRLFGSNITIGLVLGLLQFATTFLITVIYVRFANRRLDPAADAIRARLEGEDPR